MVNKENKPDRKYLQPTFFFDTGSSIVKDFVRNHAGDGSKTAKAVRLFRAVRELVYNPYDIRFIPEEFKASVILARGEGYCVAKAIVLATVARAAGIPSRLGLADVRNHLSTERLRRLIKTDVFVFHGYTELFLNGQWLKVTPTFNTSLCKRFGVQPLEFDGFADCLFHEYDNRGNKHMEYIKYHGVFADVPFDLIVATMQASYPHLYATEGKVVGGDFSAEVNNEKHLTDPFSAK